MILSCISGCPKAKAKGPHFANPQGSRAASVLPGYFASYVSVGSAETELAKPCSLPFLRAFIHWLVDRCSKMAIFFIWISLLATLTIPDEALPVASG
jgi:hypothetical protein